MRNRENRAFVQFGRALRVLRKDRGFSQEQLALIAEINRTYMGNLERGEENVSLATILKICAVLRVEPSRLLREAGM